jgi:sugar phosphate isomerase/epimerase
MSLEELFKFLVDIDVEGVEFISDQMMHGTPHPSEESLRHWDGLIQRYGLKPVCNDIFINTSLYKNRVLTTKESTKLLIDEIRLANRMGFDLIRLVSKTPPEIIEPALSEAEKHNVTLALEVHAGMSFSHPDTKAFVDVIKKLDSKYVGLVVDTGIFCRRHPRISKNYFLGLGLNPAVADYIDNIFDQGLDPLQYFESKTGSAHVFPEDLQKLFRSEADMTYAIFCSGYENSKFEILDQYFPYIKHFHGKFYEMMDDGTEYSIPYDEFIAYLTRKRYDGYIASEYEGQRFVLFDQPIEDLAQVKKHQEMLKKLIQTVGNQNV